MQCELKVKNRSPLTAFIALLGMIIVLFFVITLKGNKSKAKKAELEAEEATQVEASATAIENTP